mgnify:CR=1 FL=1
MFITFQHEKSAKLQRGRKRDEERNQEKLERGRKEKLAKREMMKGKKNWSTLQEELTKP